MFKTKPLASDWIYRIYGYYLNYQNFIQDWEKSNPPDRWYGSLMHSFWVNEYAEAIVARELSK